MGIILPIFNRGDTSEIMQEVLRHNIVWCIREDIENIGKR